MLRRIVLGLMVAAIGAAVSGTASAGPTMDRIISEKKLLVGVAPWNRFVLKNPKTGEFEGLIADDIRNLEKTTGIKVEFMNSTWAGLIAGLQAGKWDVIMSGLGATPQRAAAVAFGEPFGYLSSTAMVRADNPAKTTADLDVEGNMVSVVAGTAAHKFAERAFKNAKVKSLTDTGSAVLEVMQGRVVAYIGDSISNNLRATERPDELRDIKFPPGIVEWTSMNHAVRYDSLDLMNFLDTYTRAMKLRGWYRELAVKWKLPPELVTGP